MQVSFRGFSASLGVFITCMEISTYESGGVVTVIPSVGTSQQQCAGFRLRDLYQREST